uniref:HAT C-terminal dimerisation domain-containing protein n=1 Tax=Chromera velia CCMP2878 TaxID=1169474 RepID=A0A0G4F8B3_9ALVE|eukprot:Cvel_2956.t1-p1 / transcript=Cvel_2956.t1 / gene=Cvel_2956 / organism=Chromera_velia_CCMP2878 / gene_product=hypothetical protein / transcript_product=hypothetical protein / location=Cvel_scaffold117:18605-25798(+) / protein_length=193 / sequence_SO=supercontig / SO=protein_coding / is_pseudo=false
MSGEHQRGGKRIEEYAYKLVVIKVYGADVYDEFKKELMCYLKKKGKMVKEAWILEKLTKVSADIDSLSWWEMDDMIECTPKNAKLAEIVFSQANASGSAERAWFSYDHVYKEKRNRLSQAYQDIEVTLYSNLHLQRLHQRQAGVPRSQTRIFAIEALGLPAFEDGYIFDNILDGELLEEHLAQYGLRFNEAPI